MTERNDSRFQWAAKPGQVAHAVATGKQGVTVCGLKVGKRWLRAGMGLAAAVYRSKCATCKATAEAAAKKAARAARQP